MFESYNSNYNLDLWEACDRDTVIDEYAKINLPEGIEKTLKLLNKSLMNESIEYEGHVYDNFDQIFHIGSAQEFNNPNDFIKILKPTNLKNRYSKEQQYPVDFFIEYIDPKTLKRVSFMIVYHNLPFGQFNQGEKSIGKLMMFKGKAFAAEVINRKARLAFMLKTEADVDKVAGRSDLRISWHWEPTKTIDKLKPTEIYSEMLSAVNKLKSAGYVVYKDEDTVESFL